MPYIVQDDRDALDPHIDSLIEALQDNTDWNGTGYAGTLNYTITRIIHGLAKPNMRYNDIAVVDGVLSNVGREFYRRVAVPYENIKMMENGDIDKLPEGAEDDD